MGRFIYLFWYRKKEKHGNFGDELNPYLFERLTSQPFKYIKASLLWDDGYIAVKELTKRLLRRKINLKEWFLYSYYNTLVKPEICLAVGSVLQWCHYSKTKVWGAGIIRKQAKLPDAHYYAVRGEETVKQLKSLGLKTPGVLGDPALLLPLIYPGKVVERRHKLGVIPHFQHYAPMKKNLEASEIVVIDLLEPVESVIDRIKSCEVIYSTSLHGIIVAHAYGIPAVWFTNPKDPLFGDDIKFKDYFSSVNLPYYDPLNVSLLSNDTDKMLPLKETLPKAVLLPRPDVVQRLQKRLLKVFPYQLNEEYARLIEDRLVQNYG